MLKSLLSGIKALLGTYTQQLNQVREQVLDKVLAEWITTPARSARHATQ